MLGCNRRQGQSSSTNITLLRFHFINQFTKQKFLLGGYPPQHQQPPYGGYPPQQPGFNQPPPEGGYSGDPEVKGFDFNDESIRKGFIRKVYFILSVS